MPYLEITKIILDIIWQFVKAWWWVPFPVFFFLLVKYFYLYNKQNEFFDKIKWSVLEVKVPQDVERPLKAMEQVISNFWTLYDPADFKEKWVEGKFLVAFTLEIAGIDGDVHFFLRIPTSMIKVFESAIYSQYPDVEITEVEDYTKKVPQDIPNKDWDMWGCNFKMLKDYCYPILTYGFFEPSMEMLEHKRVDPLAVLMEGMSRLKKGEQLWLQIRLQPTSPAEMPWVSHCQAVVNELAQRPKPSPQRSITGEAYRTLVHGSFPFEGEEKKPESIIPPEMRLTPGERNIVEAIENKMSKSGFVANARMIYLGNREVFFKPNLKLMLNYSVGLSTTNLNGLKPSETTKIVAPAMFRDRRIYMKKRRLFRRYIHRWTPLYPQSDEGTYILNEEEIATMFHFPGKVGAPTPSFQRIPAKKGGPPPSLPVENNTI